MAVGKALCKVGGLVVGAVCSLRVCRALSEHTKRDKGAPGNLDLVAAQVVFRHGARTPCTTLGDTALDPSWDRRVLLGDLPHTAIDYEVRNILGGPRPVSQYDRHQMKNEMKGGSECGQLTKIGQQQMYDMGKRFRKHYVDKLKLIGDKFNPEEVYIRTSNIQRTIDSARCLLAGMFGVGGIQGTVKIYTLPEPLEYIYPNFYACPHLKQHFKSALLKFDTHGFQKNYLQLEELLGIEGKNELKNQLNYLQMYDIVAASKGHNLPLPEGVAKIWPSVQDYAIQLFVMTHCGDDKDRKRVVSLGIGRLLEEIFGHMKYHVEGSSSHKLHLFSGHDTTILLLLVALGIFDEKWPVFNARIEFELYKDREEEYFVKVLYEGKEQILPGCDGAVCPLARFLEVIAPYFMENWENECQLEYN